MKLSTLRTILLGSVSLNAMHRGMPAYGPQEHNRAVLIAGRMMGLVKFR